MLDAEKIRREKEAQVQGRIKELLVNPAVKQVFAKNEKNI